MKKNYFLLAATTMMFAACAQTDLVNEVVTEETPQAIEFDAFANKATRATENSSGNYTGALSEHHENFIVWAYKNTATTNYVFGTSETNGTLVDATDYSYDTPRYWDKSATTYEFYAAAPDRSNFWTLNKKTEAQNDDYFTTASFTMPSHNAANFGTEATTTFKDKGAVDLMIAAKETVTKPADGVFSGSVSLNFIHILSRLNVTVNTNISGVKVNNIKVGNIKSTGSFDESKRSFSDPVTGSNAGWTVTGHNGATKAPVVDYTISSAQGQALNSNGTKLIAIEALVVPQNATVEDVDLDATVFDSYKEPYLYIEYTINNELYKRAYNLADAFKGSAQTATAVAFNEGWQNTLNLKIGGDEISFTADVATWANGTTNTGGTTIE